MVFKVMNEKYDKQGDVANLFESIANKDKCHGMIYGLHLPVMVHGEGLENSIDYFRKAMGCFPSHHVYHMILCFDRVCDEEIGCNELYIGARNIVYSDPFIIYPSIFVVHSDTLNYHIHFIFSAVGKDGKCLSDKRETFQKFAYTMAAIMNLRFGKAIKRKEVQIIYG